jgi:hypothetical protein
VNGGLLLDVIVSNSSVILELFACENESLLVAWDSLFVLDFGFDAFNGV